MGLEFRLMAAYFQAIGWMHLPSAALGHGKAFWFSFLFR
jgi:hypothetical protein